MEIKLELLDEGNFPTIVAWVNQTNPDFIVQWSGLTYTFPLSVEQMRAHYHKGINSIEASVFIYKIVRLPDNEMIGSLQLCRFDPMKQEAVIGRFIIGDSNARGLGIGTKALEETVRIGFEQFNLQAIRLNVFDQNDAAIRCYERVGFRKVHLTDKVYTSSQGVAWGNWEMVLERKRWEDTYQVY